MTMWSFGAAAVTTVAMLLARPPAGWVVRARIGSVGPGRPLRPWPVGPASRIAVIVVAVVLAQEVAGLSIVIVTASAVGTAMFVMRHVRTSRARANAMRTRNQTGAVLDLLAAELRSGILPRQALAAVADDLPSLRPAAAAAVHGGDVVAALRAASTEPGAGALSNLAGAWHVAERAGAPLATVLDRVATTVREDADVDRDVQAEAAPARATGRLMAALPLLGLSLGAGLGADPVHVLTGTVVGSACLAAGLTLACAGILWVDRIVASVDAS